MACLGARERVDDGADGGIGGTYGVMPELFLKIEQCFVEGRMVEAKEWQNKVNNVITALDMPVQLITSNPAAKKNVSLKVMYKGKNLDKSSVSVASPTGWVKAVETNDGAFSFDALWPGIYVIEAYHTDKTEGNLNGKEYKLIRNTSTYSITVGR